MELNIENVVLLFLIGECESTVILPDSVLEIAPYAFDIDYFHAILEVNIPESVEKLGEGVIGGFYSPENISIPDGDIFVELMFYKEHNFTLLPYIVD